MRGGGSRATAVALLAAGGLSLAGACIPVGAFVCGEDHECAEGQCEAEGYCSMVDTDCPSGRRFAKYVPAAIAGRCVEPDENASTGSDGGSGSTGDTSSGSATATSEAGGSTTTAGESTSGDGPASACLPPGRDPAVPALLYDFCEGEGQTVRSIEGDAFPLAFENGRLGAGFDWVDDGLRLDGDTDATTALRSTSVIGTRLDACIERSEVTLEVWFTPQSSEQPGPTVIAAVGTNVPNMRGTNVGLVMHPGPDWTLESAGYGGRVYTQEDPNRDGLMTALLEVPIRQTTHLAIVHHAGGDDRLYRDGELVGSQPHPGTFATWDRNFELVLANKPNYEVRNWSGTFHLVAIYCEALDAARIQTNFEAGARAR